MATTIRTELTRAGFNIGGGGTTMIVQDYADPSVSYGHAKISGSHTITSTDPLLDRKFPGGDQWEGAPRVCAFDANWLYVIVNLPTQGQKFQKFPLMAGLITGTTPVPYVSIEKAVRASKA